MHKYCVYGFQPVLQVWAFEAIYPLASKFVLRNPKTRAQRMINQSLRVTPFFVKIITIMDDPRRHRLEENEDADIGVDRQMEVPAMQMGVRKVGTEDSVLKTKVTKGQRCQRWSIGFLERRKRKCLNQCPKIMLIGQKANKKTVTTCEFSIHS
ncbi:hypothetical protein Adt_45423 [Abeliophyllum distichum]|uniref:Uncharacterized protein n=1 Tax=Abeliophyllum distichum TaxID=126358 RepID=A0ABD1PDM3_9LAMI